MGYRFSTNTTLPILNKYCYTETYIALHHIANSKPIPPYRFSQNSALPTQQIHCNTDSQKKTSLPIHNKYRFTNAIPILNKYRITESIPTVIRIPHEAPAY